jgi:ATPase family associated with various cellular activities (AAA)
MFSMEALNIGSGWWVVLAGAVLSGLWKLLTWVQRLIISRCFTRLLVTEDEAIFTAVETLVAGCCERSSILDAIRTWQARRCKDEYQMVRTEGTVIVRNRRQIMSVNFGSSEDERSNRKLRWISITGRDVASLHAIVRQAWKEETERRAFDKNTYMYKNEGKVWLYSGKCVPRNMSSVLLPSEIKSGLVHDISRFMEDRAWYERMGIPWHRGYLLHGPPGNGKSSIISALAGELKLSICVLDLSCADLTDAHLQILLNKGSLESTIILMEDIDTAFDTRQRDVTSTVEKKSKVSFNGLLNALDGVGCSGEGRLVFMTTNHLENLDPALVRPGRIDVSFLVDNANRTQVEDMYKRFYPDQEACEVSTFAQAIMRTSNPSMATLQKLLLQNRGDAKGALDSAAKVRTSTP